MPEIALTHPIKHLLKRLGYSYSFKEGHHYFYVNDWGQKMRVHKKRAEDEQRRSIWKQHRANLVEQVLKQAKAARPMME